MERNYPLASAARFDGLRLLTLHAPVIHGSLNWENASGQLSYEGIPLHPPSDTRRVRNPGQVRLGRSDVSIPRAQSAPGSPSIESSRTSL